jgi:endoglucanase
VGGENWAEPTWPGPDRNGAWWDRAKLEAHYGKWADLALQGVGVHCGEGGAFCHTPHAVFLSWLRDVLEILTSHGMGYALWNLRGSFGMLDSGRKDAAYEDWHGRQLDRKLLSLLQSF